MSDRPGPRRAHLDSHPQDSNLVREKLLKKCLDSFALICSTSREGSKTASAVFLEQGHPAGNILRLAQNRGVPQELIDQFQQVLNDLAAIAAKGKFLCRIMT